MSMFTSLFGRKQEYGKHTDILPKPGIYVPVEATYMDYKQISNNEKAYLQYTEDQKHYMKRLQLEKMRA